MKVTIIGILLFLMGAVNLSAQQANYSIKGTIADTVSNSKLANASISVITAKDSILQKFIRVKEDGTFAINNLSKGKFIVLATYPGYADFVERFTLDSAHTTHNFGRISMLLKERLLQEVIVKGKAAAIKIKGDTTEFNPAAYNIQPNSKVEDLLKQLPGIEVDKDGKITAQGQTVKKVLVDGEEFFGDDPTLVTKNLRADMVDKVQLYDKKSDQAAFTGIDDGVKDKTINIKLKEDKKNGYFGKLDGGIGTDGYYQGQALFNRFKGKQKFSVYGTLGNTGKTGLGWEDNNKYGGGGGMEFGDDGGFYIFGGGDDLDSFDGRYNGEGKPVARTGGAHYDTKWNNDKESINTNYKIGSLTVDGTKNTQQQNNFPGNISNVNSDQTNHNYMFRQKLDVNYQLKIDSMQNLKITADGTLRNSNTRSNFATQTRRLDGSFINSNDRENTADVDGKVFNANAFYTKKFKKKSRTLSVNLRTAFNESDSKGFLKSHTQFYDSVGTAINKPDTIDQYKVNKTKSTNINTNITYTEPLAKDFTLAISYALAVNNSTADRRTFNKDAGSGPYNMLDSIYSSDYKLNQLSNQGGAVFNLQKQKYSFNIGTKVAGVRFKQVDELGRFSDLVRNFTNWYPQASFQYKFTKQSSLRLSYNGNTTQPNIDQIQPVRINTDPLNIQVGNAGLKPSFTNRYNISYNSYKVISNQYIWISGSYSTTSNPIVSNVMRDTTTGISTYQSSNLKNKSTSNFWVNSYFERKVPGIGINAGLEIYGNGNTYYNLSNNVLNETKSYSYSGSIRLSKYKEKKYDAWISAGPTYTINSSSLNTVLNNNGRGFNANGGFNIYLPGKFQIGSDGNYTYNAPTKSFPQDFRRFLLNANVSRTFMKDALKATISGNDLLNQNTGYNRTGSANVLTQERYTTIRRYFMFSLTWDFNKVGGGAPKK
ncbi:Outer membrane receptor proteins, mostly Fe transport [Mucilaginibacter gossypiicola]|uniref:Outer membrane receptor proteins, mostly Fe transport n=1 Tax=Mucilaginibacter gossypiicola TaxID=551995 RepID=A0A1H8SJX3_9SPHI|nr:outer membrane beta-barrel family protein [Mucilaginibacter gossypiicola]SEO78578.1 Outer membrane receptor proteins, mostly Fe transport [Mucilaginibacter gossypiicola]